MKSRTFLFYLTFTALLMGTTYVCLEIGMRIMFSNNFVNLGFIPELTRTEAILKEYPDTNVNYPIVQRYQDHYDLAGTSKVYHNIGWNNLYEKKTVKQKGEKHILFYGDSVTEPGYFDFVYYLQRIINNDTIRLFNNAVGNHGIFQIAVNFENSLKYFNPDLIIVSPIAHDLLRPARNYMSLMIRPTLVNTDGYISIIPKNYDLNIFVSSYMKAKDNYYLSIWTLKFFYDNRRYYFASFYKEYFETVYRTALQKIHQAALKNNTKVVLLILPQSFKFKHKEFVTQVFNDTVQKNQENLDIHFANIDDCVKTYFDKNEKSYQQQTSVLHPAAFTRSAYGECINKVINTYNLY